VVQGAIKVEEQEEELQECPDHCPSSFEKGKPHSILSLHLITLTYQLYIMMVILLHSISYRSCVQLLMNQLPLGIPPLFHIPCFI
jgi:hypothetical protein